MNVILIEDEKLSADHLEKLLLELRPEIRVIARFDTVKASVAAFEKGIQASLLFMDIHLADGNSFDIFNQVSIQTPVIFTTAYNDYAIRAFKVNSVDYLLKPIARNDLKAALDKFSAQQLMPAQFLQEISRNWLQPQRMYKSRFMVRSGQNLISIQTQEVHHFQTQESITFLVDELGKRYPIDYTLDDLEEIVQPENFFRINRKTILNINTVKRISTHLNGRLFVQADHLDGDFAVVSRERVSGFKEWLDR